MFAFIYLVFALMVPWPWNILGDSSQALASQVSAKECEDQLRAYPGAFRRLDQLEFPKQAFYSLTWIGIQQQGHRIFLFTPPIVDPTLANPVTIPETMRHQDAERLLMRGQLLDSGSRLMGGSLIRAVDAQGRIIVRVINYSGVSADTHGREDDEGLWLSGLAYWIQEFGAGLGAITTFQTNFGGRVGIYTQELENSPSALQQAISDPLRRSARTLPPLGL